MILSFNLGLRFLDLGGLPFLDLEIFGLCIRLGGLQSSLFRCGASSVFRFGGLPSSLFRSGGLHFLDFGGLRSSFFRFGGSSVFVF